jgi:uncharacterized protein (TIGR03067 family)
MRHRTLLVVTATLLVGADAPTEDIVKKDKEKLQGAWRVIVAEKNGEKRDREDLVKVQIVIAGDKLTIKDPRLSDEGMVYQLDPRKKPKEINLRGAETKEVNRGIYALDGDELKICFANEPGKARPTDFTAKAKSGRVLVVAKRPKP